MYTPKTKLYPNPLNPTPYMRLLQQEDVSISGTHNPDDPIGGRNFTVAKAPGLDINALNPRCTLQSCFKCKKDPQEHVEHSGVIRRCRLVAGSRKLAAPGLDTVPRRAVTGLILTSSQQRNGFHHCAQG